MNIIKEFTKGIYKENPVFRLALGLCPTLAVTRSIENGIGMGIAATSVLVCSNLFISIFRNLIPKKIRIPIFIVIIATFVTIVEMLMQAYYPDLHKSLGLFVPLIVVNCIILGRAEAFASRNSMLSSVTDGLGMGFGFTLSLVIIAAIREFLGNGTMYGIPVMPASFQPIVVMVLPPGAFLTLGYVLGFFSWLDRRKNGKK